MTESSSILSSASPTRLLAVIVIYKRRLQESPSFQTLLNAANLISETSVHLGILIQDNTPGGQDPGDIPEGVRYEAAPDNPGLAHAYNRALEIAREDGYDWLTTLDQDTVLPADFLVRLEELFKELEPDPTVAAIAPRVVGDGRVLSPFIFWKDILPRWFDPAFIGVSEQRTYAVNSASTLRVSALSLIGGYDPMFPLDISDINLFHRLHHRGKRVFVAGDILIHHELALLKKHQRMSIERYQAALLDECAFWDLNMSPLARLERMIRLAGRACKDFLNPEELVFRKATILELRRRLFVTKSRRIAEWNIWAKARSSPSFEPRNRSRAGDTDRNDWI